jgi:hypothetical protein
MIAEHEAPDDLVGAQVLLHDGEWAKVDSVDTEAAQARVTLPNGPAPLPSASSAGATTGRSCSRW